MFQKAGVNFIGLKICFGKVFISANRTNADFPHAQLPTHGRNFYWKNFLKKFHLLVVGFTQSILPLSAESN